MGENNGTTSLLGPFTRMPNPAILDTSTFFLFFPRLFLALARPSSPSYQLVCASSRPGSITEHGKRVFSTLNLDQDKNKNFDTIFGL